jgi:hypothetical protein
VKVGPVKMLFNAGMGVQYNSNVNVSEGNPEPDLILQPRVGAGIYWPITKLNKLRLNVQLGYDYYMQNPDLGGEVLIIDPSTEFLFNLFVNVPNLKITFFERPSVSVNPIDNATLSDAQNYAMFYNTAGVDVTWDLNDVELGIGYSNLFTYSVGSNASDYNYMNRFVNQVYADASFLLFPYMRLGLSPEPTHSTTTTTPPSAFLCRARSRNTSIIPPALAGSWSSSMRATIRRTPATRAIPITTSRSITR